MDIRDWNERLNDHERHFLKMILAFFSSADQLICCNILERFGTEFTLPEIRQFYAYQLFNESIHAETYALLIDTYIQDKDEKERVLRAIETIPVIKKKAEYVQKWTHSDRPLAERLFAFIIIEGVLFCSSFCSIFWLKSRGLMVHGLGFTNLLISKDESSHTQFGMLLYSKLNNKLTQQ